LEKEQWKNVIFDFEFANDFRLEVSNLGNVRSFHKFSGPEGSNLKGSLTNGYKVLRLKFFKAREPKVQLQFDYLNQEIAKLAASIRKLKAEAGTERALLRSQELYLSLKQELKKKYSADLKDRTIYKHFLIHRLVALHFLEKATPEQTLVGHLDYNKLNNGVSNLKWMTPDENYEHQQFSPFVIMEKKQRAFKERNISAKSIKLTVTKVMLLKKLLEQGKPMPQLVKQFKITSTQIARIKRGENWGDIKAAQ
jgi:hypothetical protein